VAATKLLVRHLNFWQELPDYERLLLRSTLLGAWTSASKLAFSCTSHMLWAQLPLMAGGLPNVAGLMHWYLQQPDKYGPPGHDLEYLTAMTQQVQQLVDGAVSVAWGASSVTMLLQKQLQQHYRSFAPKETAQAAAAGIVRMIVAKQHPLLKRDAELPGGPRALVSHCRVDHRGCT
jgi:hypothetical protein